MPVLVNGPDGKQHSFPDGTTAEEVNAQLSKVYGGGGLASAMEPGEGALPKAGDPTAAAGNIMPSMATAPVYNTPEDVQNLGLSMILPPGAVRTMQNTPGHAYRVQQAKDVAKNMASLEEKQRAGQQILGGLNMVRHTIGNAPDDVLSNAIGPTVSNPWVQGMRRTVSGLVPGPWTPYDQSYNLSNLLHHDIHGLITQFIAAGKSANMSDARQEAFNATMQDMLRATNRDDLNKVADHAEFIIRSSFGLPQPKKETPDATTAPGTDPNAVAAQVYVNPKTGEKIRWDAQAKAWAPVQ